MIVHLIVRRDPTGVVTTGFWTPVAHQLRLHPTAPATLDPTLVALAAAASWAKSLTRRLTVAINGDPTALRLDIDELRSIELATLDRSSRGLPRLLQQFASVDVLDQARPLATQQCIEDLHRRWHADPDVRTLDSNDRVGGVNPDAFALADTLGATIVYTDGSHSDRNRSTGWAWWVSDRLHASGRLDRRGLDAGHGEIAAVEQAVAALDGPLVIVTDYVWIVDAINGGAPNEQTLALRERLGSELLRLRAFWARSRASDGNVAADRLARMAAANDHCVDVRT